MGMDLFGMLGAKRSMVEPDRALPGRPTPAFTVPDVHAVLGTSLHGPWSPTSESIIVAMGCFWGAEEIYWRIPGVIATSVGYVGGFTPNPTYEEVCTGLTGHTEAVRVTYEPAQVSTLEILRPFWEQHDPTQGNRQGNDIGSQYRSALLWTTDEQRDLADRTATAYGQVIAERGYGAITTQIAPASSFEYYLAEEYHQQYLYKVPNGYRCHANTGLALPALD